MPFGLVGRPLTTAISPPIVLGPFVLSRSIDNELQPAAWHRLGRNNANSAKDDLPAQKRRNTQRPHLHTKAYARYIAIPSRRSEVSDDRR